MSDQKQEPPINIYAEATPNPNAMKFVSDRPFFEEDDVLELHSIADANRISPLGAEIMSMPFVHSVHIAPRFITVIKKEHIVWEEVVVQLREFIRDMIIIGFPVRIPNIEIKKAEKKKQEKLEPLTHDETSVKIMSILDEYIKPAVERDGGSIHFRSFRNGVVKVALGGACSGCPSTSFTLKNGVEHLLKQFLPDEVREVEADDL